MKTREALTFSSVYAWKTRSGRKTTSGRHIPTLNDHSVREWRNSTKFDDHSVREWWKSTKWMGDKPLRFWRFYDQNVRQFYVFATLMSGKQSKKRFHKIFVRQFYEFAALMSGKQNKTTISKMKTREALTFLTVRKMKTREALTFLTVFNQKWQFREGVVWFLNHKAARGRATPPPRHGVVNLFATLATEISSVSRSHTASHRTHEWNETISRFGVD